MNTENQLTLIEKTDLVPFFTKGDSVNETLQKIAKEARAHVPDVSTLKGRNAIKANVTMVTKCKTYLQAQRKNLADEYKAIPKQIDATGRVVTSFMEDLQAEVRQVLTCWEVDQAAIKAEENRIITVNADHEIAILMFNDYLREMIAEELKAEAERVQAKADQIARDKKIADDAAENARLKSEAKAADDKAQAAREIEEANQRQIASDKAAKEAAEKAVIDAEQAEQRRIQEAKDYEDSQRLQTEAAEALRLKNIETAKLEKIASEKAKQKAIEDAENRERQRVADEKAAIKKAADDREANVAHKKAINNAALEAFVNAGLSADDGKIALNAIYKNLIPNVTIVY
jgi:hypothetical protein